MNCYSNSKNPSSFRRSLLAALLLAAWFAGPAARAHDTPSADGLWQGFVVYSPGQIEADLTVEVAGDPAVGTLDLPLLGLEHRVLEGVAVEGSAVRFQVATPGGPLSFAGDLSEAGRKIAGKMSGNIGGQDLELPFELERVGEAGDERPAVEPRPVTVLTEGGEGLRTAFNRDKDDVRLVLLLSPTCMSCLGAAGAIERHVLDAIEHEDLRVYTIWGPMLGDERREHTGRATTFLSDPRVDHFWTDGHDLAARFGAAAGLPSDIPGWDTFLLYAPGTVWGEAPPAPDRFMYLNKALPDEEPLNAETLAEEVRRMLPSAPTR